MHDVLVALMAGPPSWVQLRARKLPPEIVAIAAKAMARDPAKRYQTATQLGTKLQHFIEGRATRRRAAASGPAFAFLLAIVGVLFAGLV